jgi:hypothetical protein
MAPSTRMFVIDLRFRNFYQPDWEDQLKLISEPAHYSTLYRVAAASPGLVMRQLKGVHSRLKSGASFPRFSR